MIDDEYDVVVIGAGPSGSNAAKAAAERGARVLLIEKRQEIGAPKRCGEGISARGLRELGIEPSPRWALNEIMGAHIYAPNGKRVSVRYKEVGGYVIERKMFDKFLAMEAARAGAKVVAKAQATGLIIEDGFVKGVKIRWLDEDIEVRCKVVIAADGVESQVARWAGINSTHKLRDIDSAFQYEMVVELEEPDMLELYFGNKIAPRGYVWIFPKGKDVANVGIGIGGDIKGVTAKELLDKFIKNHEKLKKGSIIEVNSGGVPVGKPLDKLVSNGLMIVGDAAHQVNAIHGGGVYEGSIAGRIAGEVCAKAIEKGDVSEKALREYEIRWREKRGEALMRIYKLRQAIELLSDEDLNMLADNLSGEDIIELTKGKRFEKLVEVLMKKPELIEVAQKLL